MSFDFLTEMAWKSAMIGAASLLIAALLRSRSAGERSAVLRTGVAVILLLPLITFLMPALPVVTRTVYESAQLMPTGALDLAAGAATAPARGMWDDPTPLIELAWLGGVMMVLLRLGVGLATLSRWTRTGSKVGCPEWRAAFARAVEASGCRRPVRLLVSDVPAPMSWGWLNPVILLDRDTVRDPGEADAVLAHELAHVARRDWLLLILARLVVALFWFNPLMWLLERRLVAEAEEAADARALEHVEPSHYAQTLLSCAQQYVALTVPASAMADAGLARRVKAILERRLRAGSPDPRFIRAAIALCALVAAPIAALKPVEAVVRVPQPPASPAAPLAPPPLATVPDVLAGPVAADAQMPPQAPLAPPALTSVPRAPIARERLAALAQVAPLAPFPPAPPAPGIAPVPPAPPARRPGDAYWSDEDSREIADAVREAQAEASSTRAEALREGARAREEGMREAMRARDEAMREVARSRDEVKRAVELARVETQRGLAAGALGMDAGARGMDQGAREMDTQADRLRSESFRNEQIARAAREGRTMTHEELLAMIPRLHAGADRMRQGADKMRRDARAMREGRHD